MTKEHILALQKAIESNNLQYIHQLLACDTIDWMTTPLKNGLYAIHYAVRHGKLEIVNLLLAKNPALINSISGLGHTPILWAAAKGYTDIVDCLAQKGANLNYATDCPDTAEHDKTPLFWAIENNHLDTVKCLLKHGADFTLVFNNPQCEEDGFFAIHSAIKQGCLDIFNYLVPLYSSNYLLGKNKYHYIHIAALYGQLEIVKTLIKQNPALLEFKDCYSQTPLLLASREGQNEVVKYLLSQGADFTVRTKRPDSEDNNKTALQLAKSGCHYKTANSLILKITKEEESAVLSMIKNGEQALELMLEEPRFIKTLLKNSRIVKLINEEGSCDTKIQPMEWYMPSTGKRLSFFASVDKFEESSYRFTQVKKLAEGKSGGVRLFENAEGQKIAVKSPINDYLGLNAFQIKLLHGRMKREFNFYKLAYPDDNELSRLFKIGNEEIYTNRFIMPFIEGEEADKFISKISCTFQLAKIVLQLAIEINRIHEIGILHGDLHKKNILIQSDFSVRIIDFGRSYFLNEKSMNSMAVGPRGTLWYAPELFRDKTLKPDTSQDVFSFGWFLNKELTNHPAHQQFFELFPSVKTFFLCAQSLIAKQRPCLELFCKMLMKEIIENSAKSADEPKCIIRC
ncbi:MAG: ankyrin repeat domain-containing protein [Tatlockia sp.]|nr:ankyrin repeat domain-containing protein [Tatlockia sp.]